MVAKGKNHETPLRSAAEVQLAINRNKPGGLDPAELDRPVEELLQELHVHQVELEMQNESLRLAQSALEDSRDRYIDLFELAPVGYLTLLSDGTIAEINLTGAWLLGRERKHLLHKRFASLVIPEERDRWNRHFMRVKTRGEKGSVELALKRYDGTVFFAQLDCACGDGDRARGSGVSLAAKDGVRITLIDITERKQAETALFNSHEMLCSILATTRDGYWHVDGEGRLIDVNAVYCQQSGYLRKELIGMQISDLDSLESAAEIAERIRRIMETGSDQFESRHRRKDGTIWHAEVSVTYRENAGAEFFVFLRDISERKHAEEALREQKEFFHLIAENIADFIAVLDLEGRRIYSSPSYQQFFNPPIDLRGTDSFAEIHPDDRERVKQVFRETVQTGIGRRLEYRFLTNDGRLHQMESRGSVIKGVDGGVARVVVVSHDITERKKAEKILQESEAFKSVILNSVAAEIVVLDRNGVIQAVNERWRWFSLENGLEPGQAAPHTDVGTNYLEICEASTDTEASEALVACSGIKAVLDGTLPSFHLEYPCHSPQQQRWFSMLVMPLGKNVIDGVVITHSDITERKLMEEATKVAARYARSLLEASLDPLVTISADGKITDINSATEQVTGVERDKLVGSDFADYFTDPENAREGYRLVFSHGFVTDFPLAIRHISGKVTHVLYNASVYRDESGKVLGVFAAARDITERKQMEEQVRHLAFHDTLTELPNRRLLSDRLRQAMAVSARSGCYGALMFLDLDNFKPLNDAYGHETGDFLLVEVADRIKRCVREMDTVARLGGDEFVVMIVELDADIAESTLQTEVVAEKIRDILSKPYLLTIRGAGGDEATVEHHCTASIGVTLFINHEVTAEDLLKRADAAMYQAKGAGRNSIHFYGSYET